MQSSLLWDIWAQQDINNVCTLFTGIGRLTDLSLSVPPNSFSKAMAGERQEVTLIIQNKRGNIPTQTLIQAYKITFLAKIIERVDFISILPLLGSRTISSLFTLDNTRKCPGWSPFFLECNDRFQSRFQAYVYLFAWWVCSIQTPLPQSH